MDDTVATNPVSGSGPGVLAAGAPVPPTGGGSPPTGWRKFLRTRYVLSAIGTILALVIVLLALPATRYSVLGTLISRDVSVRVLSSAGHTPIAGAKVTLGTTTRYTDKNGNAIFRVAVGHHPLTISKQYFAKASASVLVPLTGSAHSRFVLRVTGIVVPVEITDKIGGAPIARAAITASKSSAITDSTGRAHIVLPADHARQAVTVSAPGYMSAPAQVTVTAKLSFANLFSLVPVGSVYYLSNSSGKLNVMSSNLDGSDPKVVLAGTGSESADQAQMEVSDDSKYIALLANRDGTRTHLYVFDPQKPDPVSVNPKASSYSLIGWTTSDDLVFEIFNTTLSPWQPGQTTLMSYDPATNISHVLYSSQAYGSAAYPGYAVQYISNVNVMIDGKVLFETTWNTPGYSSSWVDLSNSLEIINADGTGLQTLYSTSSQNYISGPSFNAPESFVFSVYNQGSPSNYFSYDNGKISPVTQKSFLSASNQANPGSIYFVSPNGSSAVWPTHLNGHLTIFAGTTKGPSTTQIGNFDSSYSIYGFSSNPGYLVVSKNGNELYSMPVTGVTNESSLVQIGSYLSTYGGYYGPNGYPQN